MLNIKKHRGRIRLRPATIFFLTTFLAISILVTSDLQAQQPGLVKTKPAEGRFVKTDLGFMVPYKAKIPGTEATFVMVPIPGGTFTMGSPETEKLRNKDEGPQWRVEIEPFWMGKYEITWSEYRPFMDLYEIFKEFDRFRFMLAEPNKFDLKGKSPKAIASIKAFEERRMKKRAILIPALKNFNSLRTVLTEKIKDADAITAPTRLYDPSHTFKKGREPRQPAVTMTQYAAKQYTKWLSKLTGQFYRLPSEAEWEFACRAGTTTAFHFGDDPKGLGKYAWYLDNANETTHLVGLKKPNPWGLHDMHGNVAELVLDQYIDTGYKKFQGKTVKRLDALAWPTNPDPMAVRGGSWDDGPKFCRSAARFGTDDEEWKDEDPNVPLSPWWFTSDPSRGVGFRIIRPLNKPSSEEKKKSWEIIVEDIRYDVSDRLEEGRGARGAITINMNEIVEQLKALDKIKELKKPPKKKKKKKASSKIK